MERNIYEYFQTLFGELIKSVFGLSMFFLDTLLFYLLQSINVLIPRKKYNKYLTDCTNLRNKFIVGVDNYITKNMH